MTNPREFWNKKILPWEDGRYNISHLKTSPNILEKFADKGSASLRFRMQRCGEFLADFALGKDIVEIGCGRGLLAPTVLAAGANSYVGIDIADSAITMANEINRELVQSGKVRFTQGSMDNLPEIKADIVFSLGLLDWLKDDDIGTLFSWQPSAHHLHTISERRFSFSQLLHKIYVHIAYGHQSGGYVPQYYTVQKMLDHMEDIKETDRYIYRHSRLSFGTFVSTLPIGEQIL